VLSFARSEALRSGRGVWICALFMRKNEHHNGCRTSPGQLAEGWTDGVLLFADQEGARPGIYDAGEDLRDVGFSPTVSVVSDVAQYYVSGRGVYATAGLPAFVLREKQSGRCATVKIHADSVLPVSCRGGECEGCSRHAPE
jgi:Tfp pilus assembly protein FimT